jgi:hypothetical protein
VLAQMPVFGANRRIDLVARRGCHGSLALDACPRLRSTQITGRDESSVKLASRRIFSLFGTGARYSRYAREAIPRPSTNDQRVVPTAELLRIYAPDQPIRILQRAELKSQPSIKFPPEGPDSRLFSSVARFVSSPWSARARRHGDGRSSEDTVPDLLLSSTERAQHRRPIPQYAIAISRRSLQMCTRSGRHYWRP